MTEIVDLFSEEVESKNNLEKTLRGVNEEVLEDFKPYFNELYVDKPVKETDKDFTVIASDAGRNKVALKNNVNFFVVSAVAKDSDNSVSRQVFSDVVRPIRNRSFKDFSDRSSEILELKAINERIEKLDSPTESEIFVIIDGSLLTRMFVIPKQLYLSKYQDKKLELIEEYHKLLQKAERKNLNVIGLSKDSNTDILFRKLLEKAIHKKINVEKDQVGKLQNLMEKYKYDPLEAEEEILNYLNIEEKEEELNQLLYLFNQGYTDSDMIEKLGGDKGYTKPLEVGGISKKFTDHMERYRKNKDRYIENEFSLKLNETSEKQEFIENTKKTLNKALNYPTIVTSYWKPEKNSQPLRIDLLGKEWSNNKLINFKKTKFRETNKKLEKTIQILEEGYAGEEMHNIWVSAADNSASIKNRDMKNVYIPILSEKIGVDMRNYLKRRDKRV